jgi:hypothetical protein
MFWACFIEKVSICYYRWKGLSWVKLCFYKVDLIQYSKMHYMAQVWDKTCIEFRLRLRKLNTLMKTRYLILISFYKNKISIACDLTNIKKLILMLKVNFFLVLHDLVYLQKLNAFIEFLNFLLIWYICKRWMHFLNF